MTAHGLHDEHPGHEAKLRREARFPVQLYHHPCWLVAAVMAVVAISGYMDSVAWQQRVDEVELRARARAAEAKAARLQRQVHELSRDIEILQRQLCAQQESAAPAPTLLASPSLPDRPMLRALASSPCPMPAIQLIQHRNQDNSYQP